MSCPICVEDYDTKKTNTKHKKVVCGFCQAESCRTCLETYLISSPQDVPHCMHCRHEWSKDFFYQVTPNAFYNTTYRNHQSSILMDREMSLLPDTQAAVEEVIVYRRGRGRVEEELKEIKREILVAQRKVRELKNRHYAVQGSLWNMAPVSERKDEKERKKFIRACPLEECRGFLSSQWKCGTCECWICNKCMEPKNEKNDETHECDPDKVKTVEMININTKPCPGCGEGIFKISGCSQIFCTSCHVSFDWNTGKKVEGVIHNPHYFEWQRNRQGPRNDQMHNNLDQANLECGGMPHYTSVYNKLKKAIKIENYLILGRWNWQNQNVNCVDARFRLVNHIREVVMPRYNFEYTPEQNEDLRINYLLKELNKDKWKEQLKRRYKKAEKDREVHQILDMFTTSMTDLFLQINSTDNKEEMTGYWKEMEKLHTYTNGILENIGKMFKNKVPKISNEWQMP